MARFTFIMFFIWLAAMMLSCWAWEVARMFARRMMKEAERRATRGADGQTEENFKWPAAAVILPIKGVEEDTETNVRALLAQEYPRYRLLFAVESREDPVVPVLERLSHEPASRQGGLRGVTIETVIAGISTTRGQKVHNQLAAFARTHAADEVMVFMDADARPGSHWLRDLIKPLVEDEQVGASTGFRFYIPESPDGTAKVPSAMVCVINAAVAALLGPGWRNIAWGGSMAIMRANFLSFGVPEAWQNALSDDYVLSWCVKNKSKRKIQFVQGCLVASAADFTWPAFWEFAARQYRITKVCAPGVWWTAIGAAALYLAGLLYSSIFFLLSLIGIVPAESLTGHVDYLLAVMCFALYTCNWLRGRYLLLGGMAAFPEHADHLRKISFWYTWGYPVTLAVNLLALFKSAFGRSIQWRGVRYLMKNRLQTLVLRQGRRDGGQPMAAPPSVDEAAKISGQI
ncbi:MAG TPA: glycosyltransferase [Phycisphaerae bacterium]